MAGNVVAQGELIQFKSLLRCEACQLGNHKCVLQESDDRCILCSGSDSECIFIRSGSGQVRASKSTFPWSWLIYETSTDLFDITTPESSRHTVAKSSERLPSRSIQGEDEYDRSSHLGKRMQATSLDSSDGASKHELVRHSPFEAPLSSHQSLNFDHERPSAGWTHADDELLMLSRAQGMNWAPIANTYFPNKTPNACRKRHERLMEKRFATNSDGVSLEDLARSYMETRETMWTILADKVGEKWEHVETKCLEKGLKTLQSAARPSRAKQTFSRSNSPMSNSEFDDSGIRPEPSRLTSISLKRKAGADTGTNLELTPRADRTFRMSDAVASDHAVQVNGAISTVGKLLGMPDIGALSQNHDPNTSY